MRTIVLLTAIVTAWVAAAMGLETYVDSYASGAEVSVVCKHAVVRVRAAGVRDISYGSGVIVRHRGRRYVLTNNHVINGARTIDVFVPSEFVWRRVSLLGVDKTWDLAALSADELDESLDAVLPDQVTFPPVGTTLNLCGTESGCHIGKVVRYIAPRGERTADWLEVSTPARNGDSGCPLFSEGGDVAGVVWGTDNVTSIATQPVRVSMFLTSLAVPQQTACGVGCSIGKRKSQPVPPPPIYVQPAPVTVQTDPRVGSALENLQVGVATIATNTAPAVEPEKKGRDFNPSVAFAIAIACAIAAAIAFYKTNPSA